MAFKELQPNSSAPHSPEELFRQLPRRRVPDVMPHQKEIMHSYVSSNLVDSSDVALQLPTGSGKTLVGLLIGEWRRRKNKEKVVYLCPTRQLVHQTEEQAQSKYGLSVYNFTGKILDYDSAAKVGYQRADRIAVTTYSSLFNVNSYFNNADVLILDDVHTAESYVAEFWSVRVPRVGKHAVLHEALCEIFRSYLMSRDFARLKGRCISRDLDHRWVEKVPTPFLVDHANEISETMDSAVAQTTLQYSWSMIRDHLHVCHVYLSAKEILLRPFLPPTWTHEPFAKPSHRIYMSATLGNGGDLERLMGRRKIDRLRVPNSWDRQGVGRRFFMFPGISLADENFEEFRNRLMLLAGRSLVLVPNDKLCAEILIEIQDKLEFTTFEVEDIEESKQQFVDESNAVAVVANRYDGIDFPGDECRLLFIQGLPKATNLQEYFLANRMGANILFNERVQVRVLQAIGRCTRSLEDYSAVVVSGVELTDYLADIHRQKFLHPELQAEISFGMKQSVEMSIDEMYENFQAFLENGEAWEYANGQIVNYRATVSQEVFPLLDQLRNVVKDEVKFQERLWQEDYESALDCAEKVLNGLEDPQLRGYRALWHYFAGSAATMATKNGLSNLAIRAKQGYVEAKRAATGIPWLVKLSAQPQHQSIDDAILLERNANVLAQVERLETLLEEFGTSSDTQFSNFVRKINQGLNSANTSQFENSHAMLGKLIGFEAGNVETEGAPDPWWLAGKVCIVFEDHTGANSDTLISVSKARQVFSHPNWVHEYVELDEDTKVQAVLVTPARKTTAGAQVHLTNVSLWELNEFKEWALNAISIVRALRTDFYEPGNLEWRAQAVSKFEHNQLDANGLLDMLTSQLAIDILQVQSE
ncbi:MAG: DEAD/DEAH box helicase [Gammaproteobacteria bacterium]|nr:DEAD/DEAH box helicase [Gammaproteobacteria bacterium]